jgi:hypothetical protein
MTLMYLRRGCVYALAGALCTLGLAAPAAAQDFYKGKTLTTTRASRRAAAAAHP